MLVDRQAKEKLIQENLQTRTQYRLLASNFKLCVIKNNLRWFAMSHTERRSRAKFVPDSSTY